MALSRLAKEQSTLDVIMRTQIHDAKKEQKYVMSHGLYRVKVAISYNEDSEIANKYIAIKTY